MRIRVDYDLCTGHALCLANAPDVYELDDEGFNVTPAREVPPELREQARRGAAACPERAIFIEEDGVETQP